jgi:glycogen debranching enzyme
MGADGWRSVPRASAPPGDEPPAAPLDAVAVFRGSTFAMSLGGGDIAPGNVTGLFHADTRHLSRFELRVQGQRLASLSTVQRDPHEASFFLTNAEQEDRPGSTLSIERRRRIQDGMHERITVRNHANEAVVVVVDLDIEVDFADLFEVKGGAIHKGGALSTAHDASDRLMRFRYERGPFDATTEVRFSDPPTFTGNRASLRLEIPARAHVVTTIDVTWPSTDDRAEVRARPARRTRWRGWDHRSPEPVTTVWPELVTGPDLLRHVWSRSTDDLDALGLEMTFDGGEAVVPAAGLPWFMALFGRDSLLTAYEALPFSLDLARGALVALAALQGTDRDDFRDMEPGKIMHELRHGELTALGVVPHRPYYGSVDATPLWLVLLSEYHRLSGDVATVRDLWPNAERAIAWIEDGLEAGDGFLRYATRSERGLRNQGWKDSEHGVAFRDGTLPTGSIAVVEAQGYAFDALTRAAGLARDVMDDEALEASCIRSAEALRDRFDDAFWVDGRKGAYALALDGADRQVDALTSNIGHLLWSGIVPERRAGTVAARLFSDDLWSGWGVRTEALSDAGSNPLGYHTGTVWAHDNAVIGAGLARAGFREEANRIGIAMFEAAGLRGYRLPEAFAGYPRAETEVPVRYPTASDP